MTFENPVKRKRVNFHLELDGREIVDSFVFCANDTDEKINEKYMEWINLHLRGYWSYDEEDEKSFNLIKKGE